MGYVTKEVNALGYTTHREYDANGNLIKEVGPYPNHEKNYTYDFSNRLIRIDEIHSDGVHLSTSYRYDLIGNKIASIDHYGNETRYLYDECNRLVQTIYPQVDASTTLSSHIQYDIFDNPTREIDTAGFMTETAYTIRGQPYKKIYPDGTHEHWEYEPDGSLKKSIATNGLIRIYFYDSFNRQIAEETYSTNGCLLSRTSKSYQAFHLASETDPQGIVTHYHYDSAGRLSKIEKEGRITLYTYDALGHITKTRNFYGNSPEDFTTKAHIYDHLDRIVEETMEDPSGQVLTREIYEYDEHNHRIATYRFTDIGASITHDQYNSRGEIILSRDPKGNQTRIDSLFDYRNELGQSVPCSRATDPMGLVTTQIHDVLRRPAKTIKQDPFGQVLHTQTLGYDAKGNLNSQIEHITSSNGLRTIENRWTYDSMNRIVDIYESLGSLQKHTNIRYNSYGQKEVVTKPDGVQQIHRYDDLGRLSEYFGSDQSFHYVYTYDLHNNPILVHDLINDTTTSKTYNAHDNVLSETLGSGLTLQYHYDFIGRPTCVIFPDNSSSVYTYSQIFLNSITRLDPLGEEQYTHTYQAYDKSSNLLAAKMIKNAGSINYTIDIGGRTTRIETQAFSSNIQAYDNVGNITKKSTVDPLGEVVNDYTYTPLYQLKTETGSIAHSYTYDSISNRLSKDSCNYTVNDLNQVLSDDLSSYRYDRNGNLIEKKSETETTHYSYDALDRLITVVLKDKQVNYTYDQENRRLSKTVVSSTDKSETINYLYQGLNETGSYNALGDPIELRILGIGQGAEIGATVAIELNQEVYAPIHDLHGNITTLLDAETGQVVEFYRLSAFGETLSYDQNGQALNSPINPWRFSCKRLDEETNFVYFGRRYYDPSLGRWITADPLGFTAGPNLYAYVNNAPLTHIDLYGLYEVSIDGFINHPTNRFLPRRQFFRSSFDRSSLSSGGMTTSHLLRKKERKADPTIIFDQHMMDLDCAKELPSTHRVGSWRIPKLGIGFSNGIKNTLADALESGNELSELAGGHEVDVVYNPSGGLTNDISRYFRSRNYYASRVVPVLHKTWDNFFDENGEDARYLQVGSSEAIVNIRNALMSYNHERREQITVLAIAPSAYIDRKYCKRAIHYTSQNDFVYLLDRDGMKRNASSLHILKKHENASFFDHSFCSPTFTKVISDHVASFLNG